MKEFLMKLLYPVLLILISMSCLNEGVDSIRRFAINADYFPLESGGAWEYVVTYECNCDCPCSPYFNEGKYEYTHSEFVDGDALLNDIIYKKIVNEDRRPVKFLRKEGSRYYEWNGPKNDHLFLDTSIPPDSSWTSRVEIDVYGIYRDLGYQVTYTVLSIDTVVAIENKTYNDVIAIKEFHDWSRISDDCSTYTRYSYYAPGIGRIRMYQPYNSCYQYLGNITTHLLKGPQ